jgi:hypothetical protein
LTKNRIQTDLAATLSPEAWAEMAASGFRGMWSSHTIYLATGCSF